jgi:hypothetical protein
MSDLMGIQVIWDRSSTNPTGKYSFLCEKENENHKLGTSFFVHKRITSAVKRVQFVSDKLLYIILTGLWCSVTLNVHDPTDRKIDDNFYKHIGTCIR